MRGTTRVAALSTILFALAGVVWFVLEGTPPRLGFEDTDDPAVMVGFIRQYPEVFVQAGTTLVLMAISLTIAVHVIIAIAVVYTPIFARVVRGPVLALKARDFVEAARAIGATQTRIVARHIVPNLLSTLIVQVSLALSWAVLTEGALSFLGLSAQPPAPSWGVMLNEGRQYLELATHLAIFPGLAIMIAVLGFNLLGDGLRDALDPQRR